MIHVKYCKKCKRAYDMMTCPFCNAQRIKDKENKIKKEKSK